MPIEISASRSDEAAQRAYTELMAECLRLARKLRAGSRKPSGNTCHEAGDLLERLAGFELPRLQKLEAKAGSLPGSDALAKAEQRAITFGDIVARQCIAMQAAVIEGKLGSPADGLRWISNTLLGPGLFPDLGEARAIGGAQAWFDREADAHDKFRAEHPGPAPLASTYALMLTEQQRLLLDQAATYLDGLADDSRRVGLDSQTDGCVASAHEIRKLLRGGTGG